MTARSLSRHVNQMYSLLGRGLKWSYDRYGIKGAVAFLAVVGITYYLASDRLDRVFGAGPD